jgi:outer membrane immunogenic protein
MVALVGAASAADLPPRYNPGPAPMMAPSPFPSPVQNWTGLYIGINGGYGWGRSDWTAPGFPRSNTGDFDVSGGLVGGTAGYNWQSANWVYGLEGDIDWSDIKGTTHFNCSVGCTTKNSWLSTVRGRVGYTYGQFLPFITGGLAIGDIRASGPTLVGGSDTNVGWTFGGGIEYALLGNFTIKAEYLYVDLGDFNCGANCGVPLATNDKVSFRTNIFRGGVNMRF